MSSQDRVVQVGPTKMVFGKELGHLRDATDLSADSDALNNELNTYGYLRLRGLIDRGAVMRARSVVLEHMNSAGAIDVSEGLDQGVLMKGCGVGCVPFMEGSNDVTHHRDVLRVIESQELKSVFSLVFGEAARSFDFKWLRGMHSEGFTGVHVDNVYMSRGSSRLLTAWVPLDDIPMEMGTLAVCEGSNRLPEFARFHETYGNMDVEAEGLQGTGWFTEDPAEVTEHFGGVWKSSDFQAGDVMIFTMRTAHMSTVNTTNRVRLSCDTRWLPLSEQADPRYVGPSVGHTEAKFGVFAKDEIPCSDVVTMEQKKLEWALW